MTGHVVVQKQEIELTRTETRVFKLIAAGLTNKQCADELCVSKRTVDFHITNVYNKIGVRNRLSAIYKLQDLGLIEVRRAKAA